MNFYAYSAPGAIIPPEELGDDLCKEEIWKDYVDCGMTMFMLTGKNGYSGEGWEQSRTKVCFDFAKKFGIERVIFDDKRLIDLIALKDKLVGEENDCKFSSEHELDEFIKKCISEYVNQENFYGLRLYDEPDMSFVKSYGEVYRSIKRVAKALGKDYIYLQMNLLPLVGDYPIVISDGKERSVSEAYEYYLETYFSTTGADIVSTDNYPFRPSYTGGVFLLGYYTCFQIFRKVCDKYNATMSFAMQTFESIHKTKPEATAGYRRITSINEMMLQMNSALGFGVRDISFYTYVTMKEYFPYYRSLDGSSFVTWKGKKTRIYEYAKSAIAHAKRLEKVLFSYDFRGANLSVHEDCDKACRGLYLGGSEFTTLGGTRTGAEFDNSYHLRSVNKVSHDRDIMLITEFEKQGNEPYMLMLQNVLDSVYKTTLTPMRVKAELKNTCIRVFKKDTWELCEIKDGVYETELFIGEAVYIIPM